MRDVVTQTITTHLGALAAAEKIRNMLRCHYGYNVTGAHAQAPEAEDIA